jgi:nitrogen fixation NifU-like protein
MVMGEDPCFDLESVGKLAAFSGVSAFPVRVKCASLAWHTLNAAMKGETTAPTLAGKMAKGDPK